MKKRVTVAVSGWYPLKGQTVTKAFVNAGCKFLVDKGVSLLGVDEVNAVVTGTSGGSSDIGMEFCKHVNVISPLTKSIDWDGHKSAQDASTANREDIFDGVTHAVLFCKSGKFNSGSESKALKNLNIPVLVYDVEKDLSILTTGKNLDKDMQKEWSPKNNTDKAYLIRVFNEMLKQNVVAIDVETTGFGDEDQVIQLAIVDVNTEKTLFSSLLNTPKGTSQGAYEHAHGIKDSERKDSPTLDEVYPEIAKILSKRPVIAFNAKFDYNKLMLECYRLGLEVPCTLFYCGMEMGKSFLGRRTLKLVEACEEIGYEYKQHDAAEDCIALSKFLKYMANGGENE